MILRVENLLKKFGGVTAIDGVDFQANKGEIIGIIGPNGSGKTTLFNIISGFFPPTDGRIIFNNRDITGLKSHQIANLGIARTFQASVSFKRLSVLENVFTACHMSYKTGIWQGLLYTRSSRKEEEELKQKALEILDFVGLVPQREKLAGELSSGNLKLLIIAIALAANPKILMLDEPVTTLSEGKVAMVMELVNKVRRLGTTVLIIEHNMKAIMNYCDRITVLAYGKKIAEGLPKEISENPEVIESYLGVTL